MQPVFNFQGSAALSVLAFLGTGFLFAGAAGTALYLWLRGRRGPARLAGAGGMAVAGIYALALLGFSAAAREAEVPPGREKYFCEVDCHLAYAVLGTQRVEALGAGPHRRAAEGAFEVVAVRVRFDRETVSRRRGGRALYPSRREVRLLDDAGRTYLPSPEGLRALESMGAPQPPLSRPLRPGEAYVTRLVFDLPADARGRRLLIREKDLVTRFLIGHENSPFHPAVAFRVGNERSAP